jgi:uncharacterized membrane protein YbhN (UPF0104 family)
MPWRRYGPWLRRALSLGLLALGVVLWVRHLHAVDWQGMLGVIAATPRAVLLAALGFTLASYTVYASFDLLARHVSGARVGARRMWTIGVVSHACALSLGPAGVGFRLRLYARHGIDGATAAAIWIFNVATNWLGFVLLAGAAFASGAMRLPQQWRGVTATSPAIGFALLAFVATYLGACALAHGRSWTVMGRELTLPSLPVAALQCLLSALNWALLAGLLTVLMQHRVGFIDVLGALMTSALALAVVDVPGGLGVTETVFLALLGSQVPGAELLAALLAYRAIYFLGPLLAALIGYVALEFDAGTYRARLLRLDVRGFRRSPNARFLALHRDAPAPRAHRSSSGSTQWPP